VEDSRYQAACVSHALGYDFKGRTSTSSVAASLVPPRNVPLPSTPANLLRPHNAPVPHTVGHCHLRRLSFLKSLSADVPEYQRDIEASRSVA